MIVLLVTDNDGRDEGRENAGEERGSVVGGRLMDVAAVREKELDAAMPPDCDRLTVPVDMSDCNSMVGAESAVAPAFVVGALIVIPLVIEERI